MPSIFNSLGSNYDQASGAYRLRLGGASRPSQLVDYLKQRYAASDAQLVYKGREALAQCLRALNLPAGSSVAINGYTCYAVYQSVVDTGLKPYYLDISRDSLDFGPETLRQALDGHPEIKAVIVQNTLGLPVDITAIQTICAERQLPVIEDMAHCVGMRYDDGSEAGTKTLAAAFSFSQDKMIDAVTGGAAIVRQGELPAVMAPAGLRLRFTARIYPWLIGFIRRTHASGLGKIGLRLAKLLKLLPGPMSGNAQPAHRLPSWNAGLTLLAFDRLEANVQHRQAIAAIYRAALPAQIQFEYHAGAVYLRFPLKIEKADELVRYLRSFGIGLGTRWYDAPIAPKWVNAQTDYQAGTCPNAEWMSERMVNLPTHVHVSEKEAHFIAERVAAWLQSTPAQ